MLIRRSQFLMDVGLPPPKQFWSQLNWVPARCERCRQSAAKKRGREVGWQPGSGRQSGKGRGISASLELLQDL